MDFEVYCDEALPDLFTSQKPRSSYLMIGAVWLPISMRAKVKADIKALRRAHNVWGEIKWTKISPSRVEFYKALIDLFVEYESDLRFRCIAVDRSQVDFRLHDNDTELGFYKFYYQLIHHWLLDYNTYTIFCDTKSNRDPDRLKDLRRCLNYANMTAKVERIQALPSAETALIQLCDVLLGAASSRLNQTLREGTAKEEVVHRLEDRLGLQRLRPTHRNEEKFNVFRIQLGGGW